MLVTKVELRRLLELRNGNTFGNEHLPQHLILFYEFRYTTLQRFHARFQVSVHFLRVTIVDDTCSLRNHGKPPFDAGIVNGTSSLGNRTEVERMLQYKGASALVR